MPKVGICRNAGHNRKPVVLMELKTAIEILTKHNVWRKTDQDPQHPRDVANAIECVKNHVELISQFGIGERILVRDEDHEEWEEREYIAYIPNYSHPYLCQGIEGEITDMAWKQAKRP
jgi:hypothetical protein